MSLYQMLAESHPKIQRGQVSCRKCGHTQTVDPAYCLHYGWPKHCGYTMTLDSPDEAPPEPSHD